MKHAARVFFLMPLAALMVSCDASAPDSAITRINTPPAARDTSTALAPSPLAGAARPSVTPAGIGPDEQDIYSVLVADMQGRTILVRTETISDTYPRTEEEAWELITSNLVGASSETVANYLSVNSKHSMLTADMNLGVKYLLISTPEFVELTSGPAWQETWRARFPDSEVGCLGFSRVGFNDSHDQALVYLARLWVDGGYYVLERDAEKAAWEIVDRFSNMIID